MLIVALAFLTAMAGWYYLFYSRAADELGGIEDAAANRMRVRSRRAGGLCMFVLGICFFSLYRALESQAAGRSAVYLTMTIFGLLLVLVVLALVDLRLTWKLRKAKKLRRTADKSQ